MPVDPNVFNNIKMFADYQRAQDEFDLKKALAASELAKANKFDIDQVGQMAFYKTALGQPLSPQEMAAGKVYDATHGGGVYTDTFGNVIQKPRISDMIGLGSPPQQVKDLPIMPQQPLQQPQGALPPAQRDASITSLYGDKDEIPPADNFQDNMKNSSPRVSPKIQLKLQENEAMARSPQVIFDKENKLRDEFNNLTKDFRTVNDAYNKIQSTSNTGAGDMSMLYQYVKLLDPGSVVRESEFASAAAAGSYGERLQGAVKSIRDGGRLAPSLRQIFLDEATNIYVGQKQQFDQTFGRYKDISEREGLKTDNVIYDYSKAASIPKAAAPIEFKKGQVYESSQGRVLFNGGDPKDPKNYKKLGK